jgi:hypothetical protein
VLCFGTPPELAGPRATGADLTLIDLATADVAELHRRWGNAEWEVAVLLADAVARLRLAAPLLDSLGSVRELRVMVADGAIALPSTPRDLSGALQPVALAVSRSEHETWITLRFDEAVRLRSAVARAVELRGGADTVTGLRVAVADVGALEWCAGDPSAQTTANADQAWRGDRARGAASDVVLVTRCGTAPTGMPTVDVSARCPPVDVTCVNPRDFAVAVDGPPGLLVSDGVGGLSIRVDDTLVARFGTDAVLDLALIRSLRWLRHIDLGARSDLRHVPPVVAARLVTRLAAAGVPLLAPELSPELAELLAPDLRDAVTAVTDADLSDPLAREVASVRLRRTAMRRHSHRAVWNEIRRELGIASRPDPTVSVLLCTRRPERLADACAAVGDQQHVSVELILVTHGFTLTLGERAAAADASGCPLTVIEASAEVPLGDALNAALDAARGDVVAKMDDDDWYGPHHLEDMVQALGWSGAVTVGTAFEFVYLVPLDITIRRRLGPLRERPAPHVAGPTMTIRRDDLRALGGWRPVAAAVDLALSHAVRQAGGTVHATHGLGFLLGRHGHDHTWSRGLEPFLRDADQQWRGFRPPPEITQLPRPFGAMTAL